MIWLKYIEFNNIKIDYHKSLVPSIATFPNPLYSFICNFYAKSPRIARKIDPIFVFVFFNFSSGCLG